MLRALPLLAAILFASNASAQWNITLSPKTVDAFETYRKTAEAQLNHQPRYAQLKPGEIRVDPAHKDGSIDVPLGIVHDWVGAAFAPKATVDQVLSVLQNYPAYKTIYAPEVADSKVLSHNGNQYRVALKLVKTAVLTAILNSEYEVEYRDLGANRWSMTSRSTRMAELDGSKEMPIDTGHGYLWRLNAYWLIEPRNGGVYMECRSVSLSRDVPFGLGFAIRPFVTKLPPEGLRATLESTIKALSQPSTP